MLHLKTWLLALQNYKKIMPLEHFQENDKLASKKKSYDYLGRVAPRLAPSADAYNLHVLLTYRMCHSASRPCV